VNGIVSFAKTVVNDYQPRELVVTYFGGEPLLDFSSLAAISGCIQDELPQGLDARQAVITNGTLLGRYAPALREIGVTTAQVTLDGPPEVHDRRRVSEVGVRLSMWYSRALNQR
jgi:uncharacterized protein